MAKVSKKEQLRRQMQALYQRDMPVSEIAEKFGKTEAEVVRILGL